MTLNTAPANLLEEIEYAIVQRDLKLAGVQESLDRRCGPDRAPQPGQSPAPENTEHEYLSYLDAQLAFDRPIASLESPLVSKQDEVLALEVGLNRWIKASKLRQVLRQGVLDFGTAWFVTCTSVEPAPELGEGEFKDGNGATMRGLPHRPYTKRIPFRAAFRDPLATSPWEMRFAGHAEVADKDSLIKRAEEDPDGGWHMDVIRALPTDSDLQKVGRATSPGNPTRNEVVFYNVWVADAEIEEGELEKGEDRKLYHGKLFTIALSINAADKKAEGISIRDPRPFFGPRWGPYSFIGAHIVTDDAFFMSPLQPARSAIKRLNDLNDVGDAADAAYKRLLIANSLVEDFAQIVKNGKHDHVFDMPGFEKGSAEAFEIGGRTTQMLLAEQRAKEKVDRLLGMGDVQRGAVTGEGSATETNLAAEASAARMSAIERAWRTDGVSQLLLTPAWYICHDKRVKQPISLQEFKRIGGDIASLIRVDQDGQPVLDNLGEPIIEQPYIHGGTDDYDWFDSLDLEIEAWSMRHMSEGIATAQAQFLLNYTQMIAPLVPTMPWVQWDLLHRTLAKLTGIQEMRNLVNLQVAGEVAGAQALIQMAERQALDDDKADGAKAPAAPKAQQAMAKPAQPMAGATQSQGGAQNAPGGKPKPLPGRQSGGEAGNQAAQSAGAA